MRIPQLLRSLLTTLAAFFLVVTTLSVAAEPEARKSSADSAISDATLADGTEAESATTPVQLASAAPTAQPPAIFENMMVIGSAAAAHDVPGSADFIDSEQLERQDYGDIHRILRQVPGINIQDEDGYGLRPNIGMRGTGVERSQKITMLEDGVLIAPAPYAAPAAYYTPTAGRMESFEVRKGSSAIRQGPFTTGGALNFVSTSIPGQLGGRVNLAGGTDSTARLHATFGDSRERFAWLLETYQLTTDGFKELDNGGDTGVTLQDYMGKFRINSASDSPIQQSLELKLGKTTQEGDETYVGLTENDFLVNPYRRYAGSQLDVIDTDHEQVQLSHLVAPAPDWSVTTTVYRNDFFRNWYKLDSVSGVSISSVLDDPQANAGAFAILRGETDDSTGALRIRANRRSYESEGVQTVLWLEKGTNVRHDVRIGARFHRDSEDRFQEDDRYGIENGTMFLVAAGAPGSNANRVVSAEALAFFVEDQIRFGRWTVTPGLRFETIDFLSEDFGRADPDRTGTSLSIAENDVDELLPGLGVSYDVNASVNVFGGVHKGFAPPGPGANEETQPESSINYELGARYAVSQFQAKVIGFFNDYENLLGRDTLSGGGTGSGDLFNGGEIDVYGAEVSIAYDIAAARRWGIDIPLQLAYTYTSSEFQSSFTTGFPDWTPSVDAGDELPYLPENQWTLGAGVTANRWDVFASLNYTDPMRTAPGQGAIPAGTGTDEALIFDLSAGYRVRDDARFFVQVRNVTDEDYIVARRPAGLRPGLPRTAMVGISWDF
ncbi:MAG: TonB-dependent receptor family protein [Thermoanaerobaculia bacterium]